MRNIKTREGYDLWDKVHELPRFNFWRGGEDEKGCVIRVPEKHGNWVNFNDLTTLAGQCQDEINSLRERLARLELKTVKQCSPALQHQGEPVVAVAVAPEGYCIMPIRLTAENGAKALLLGEFTLKVTMECQECVDMEEPSEGCEICDGEGEYGQKHMIPWDQIKFIYSKAVEGLAIANGAKP